MIIYIETSAAAKLLTSEVETAALERYLDAMSESVSVVSGLLLETELRRLAVRESLPQADVTLVLDGVKLLEAGPKVFRTAGLLPGHALRSLDAIYLASAILERADTLLTYDGRLVTAAAAVGLATMSPL